MPTEADVTTYSVTQLRKPLALSELGAELDQLAAQFDLPVMARRRWLQIWVDTHPAWQPWLVAVRRGGQLVAVAMLATRLRGPLMEIVALGHDLSDDVRLPAMDDEAAEHLVRGIVAGLPSRRPWRLQLRQVRAPGATLGALAAALPNARRTAGQGMPLVEGLRQAAPPTKNQRKQLKKMHSRLRNSGVLLEATWTRDPDTVAAVVPELLRVHRERDLDLGRRPDHDDPAAAEFYRRALVAHAAAGELDLLTLRLDGDLASYACGFRDGRTLRIWDSRVSPRWADFSAGRLAHAELFARVAAGDDYDNLDWLRGEDAYKLQSATTVVPTEDLLGWSSSWLRLLDEGASQAVDWLRRQGQRHPELWRRLKRLRYRALRDH